jgi:hypothetical protein
MLTYAIGKYTRYLAAIAFAFGLSFAFGGSSAQAAQQCYGYYTGQGKDYNKKQAKYQAVYNWEQWVASRYGKYYADWDYASYKSVWCDYRYSYWYCWAKARPCYYGGGGGGGGGGGSGY